MEINNREALIEELAELLMQFDKGQSKQQTDVYLYYHEDTKTAELDTFENPGGNSWLDDDHYTIYTDKEHYDNGIECYFEDVEYIADVLNLPLNRLEAETKNHFSYDEEDAVSWNDIWSYAWSNSDYHDKLQNEYNSAVDDHKDDYLTSAEEIFSLFEHDQEEIKRTIEFEQPGR